MKNDVTAGNAQASTWRGTGSSSEFNYGYYITNGTVTDGTYVAPN